METFKISKVVVELPDTSFEDAKKHYCELSYDPAGRKLTCEVRVDGQNYKGVFVVSENYFTLDLLGAARENSNLSKVEHKIISGPAREKMNDALQSVFLTSGIQVRALLAQESEEYIGPWVGYSS